MKKDPKDLISRFGLCEPKSDNIIRVQVVCLPSANQSSGSLVPGSRTVTSIIMHENLNEISSLGFGSVICSFGLRVLPKGCLKSNEKRPHNSHIWSVRT
jgi:hypothetical protein